MSVLLLTHPACLDHWMGEGHPERPDRLRAILDALDADAFASLVRREAPRAEIAALERVHDPDYVRRILSSVPTEGLYALDPDTALSPGSGEAALRAAGAAVAAVDAVVAGEVDRAFCAIRPPGHHAERDRAMGFCLFNNIAIAAMQARAVHRINRIAVVDFDVHHGNGTQHEFADDPDLLYISTHQHPLFPGTGLMQERGVSNNVMNLPMLADTTVAAFRDLVAHRVIPALDKFTPDLILISAGFDGHKDDPVGGMAFDAEDYYWVTRQLVEAANRHCGGKVVSVLEGGYDLRALAQSSAAHVRALMEP